MTPENTSLPGLMERKILTKIKMQIPACVPRMSPLASILRPCGPYCCRLVGSPVVGKKWDNGGEREKEKQTVSFEPQRHKISLSFSLSPSLSGRRRRSEILVVINPLSWLFNHGSVQTSRFVPDGLGHNELWDSCGTTFPTSSERPFPCWVLPWVQHPARARVRHRRQKQTRISTDAFFGNDRRAQKHRAALKRSDKARLW